MAIYQIGDDAPQLDATAWVADSAQVIGRVRMGPGSSVWYGAVLRGDNDWIIMGARSNIQDGSVIHCDSPMPGAPDGFPTLIGEDVLVGHMAMIHGATLHDRAFVGLSTTVMNGCVIESDGMLGAGALLTPGKRIATGQLWTGRPAAYARDLNDRAIAEMRLGVAHYVENGRAHAAALRTKPDPVGATTD